MLHYKLTHTKLIMPNRILLMFPTMYLLYINQGLALCEAFEKVGVHCIMLSDEMNEDSYKALLSGYAPNIVISINSPKRPAMEDFPNIRHIRWLQDNQFAEHDYLNEPEQRTSDILYMSSTRLKNGIFRQGNQLTSVLPFAAKPVAASYSEPLETDFSLIGYIPHHALLNASFTLSTKREFKGYDYFAFLELFQGKSFDFPLETLAKMVDAFLKTRGTKASDVTPELLRLLREDYLRAFNRSRFVRLVLSLGNGCQIYGPDEWKSWPEFAAHHRSILPSTAENLRVYRATRINLHNGGTISHPRVLDCMSARGGPLMCNGMPIAQELGLQPGIHYVEFDYSDFEQHARALFANSAMRKTLSEAAYAHIVAHHTWDHRVQQILRDLAS